MVKFEDGNKGICFSPVKVKKGGVGTEYAWTEGKKTDEIDSVFVISSSSAEALEVIQEQLSEAIKLLSDDAGLESSRTKNLNSTLNK